VDLLWGLLGQLEREELIHHIEVVARVEHDQPVRVLDQHAVDREPDRRSAPDVPGDVRLVDHERAAVEQAHLGRLGHANPPLVAR